MTKDQKILKIIGEWEMEMDSKTKSIESRWMSDLDKCLLSGINQAKDSLFNRLKKAGFIKSKPGGEVGHGR